jgi:hypothetical protein
MYARAASLLKNGVSRFRQSVVRSPVVSSSSALHKRAREFGSSLFLSFANVTCRGLKLFIWMVQILLWAWVFDVALNVVDWAFPFVLFV